VLARYSKNSQGKLVKIADIYSKEEHGIHASHIDPQAYAICKQLIYAGAQGYIVGGAIRDILLGREPKDWDIVTNEHPIRLRKIFKRSRIIGKRFKLVHVVGSAGGLFEVATFRSRDKQDEEQPYGTLEEDAFRRDFTLNALYYDVMSEQIIDFHGGYQHIRQRIIYPVVPLKETFLEDPVRMIRAVKSAKTSASSLDGALLRTIKKQAKLLDASSNSRLSEELLKVLVLAECASFLATCYELKLLHYWLPRYAKFVQGLSKEQQRQLWQDIEQPPLPRGKRFSALSSRHKTLYAMVYPYVQRHGGFAKLPSDEVVLLLKSIFLPVVLPNKDLFVVIKLIAVKENLPRNFFQEQEYLQRKRQKRELASG
jgi:poly(A) polymerase